MAFCTKCGSKVADMAAFCPSCGAGLPVASGAASATSTSAVERYHKDFERNKRTGTLIAAGIFLTIISAVLLAQLGALLTSIAAVLAAALLFASMLPKVKPKFALSYIDKASGETVSLLWWIRSYFGWLALFLWAAYAIETTPAPRPPFYQPGAPADLVTMLSRGDTSKDAYEGLDAEATAAQDLCKVLVKDYTKATYSVPPLASAYRYGSTASDPTLSGLVDTEADLLVMQLQNNFIDRKSSESISRRRAEALLHDAAVRYGAGQQDPVVACLTVMPGLAKFGAH